MSRCVVSIDQGTTGTTALLIDQRLSLTVSVAAVACALAATALVAAVWQVRAAARERRPSGIMRS